MSQKILKKRIAGQDASKTSKKSKMSKKVKVPPMCRGKKAVHHSGEYCTRKCPKKNFEVNTSSYTDPEKNPEGVGKYNRGPTATEVPQYLFPANRKR
jgi:hypothetical protein